MWTDPIVEETRRIRDEHARQFNYDLAAIFADIKRFEASLPGASFALNEGEDMQHGLRIDGLEIVNPFIDGK